MRSLKKAIRLLWLVFLIVLASVGIGLGGAVPIPRATKKEDIIELNIELVESEEDKAKLLILEHKKQ